MHINNKYYFINKFDTNNIDKQDKNTIIIYRDYSEKKIDKLLILKIKNYCKKKKIKFYLSNNIKMAIKLDLDGAYIPSFNKSTKHLAFSLKKKFNLIGIPYQIIIGKKSDGDFFEFKETGKESKNMKIDEIADVIKKSKIN